MKRNIEFYPHYSLADQHAKFKMLRVQFGWEGEGKFWALNNRIALSEECCLDISKKYNKAALANDLNFTLEKFDEFINFLNDECELIKKCGNGSITTDIIQETFAKVMGERGKARERHRRSSCEKIKTSGEKIDIVKDSKVKKRKDKDFLSDSIEFRLADYLFKFILRNNPGHKKPNLQEWSKKIDLMLRVDKRSYEEIKAVIEWCQKDDFWHKNILCTSSLRERYDALVLRMKDKRGGVDNDRFNFE